MNVSELTFDDIGNLIRERRSAQDDGVDYIPPELLKPDLAYLTEAERERLLELKLALPSFGEEALAARERLKKRMAARRKA